jgi:branched-chain amino acid transport system ATP-binding protein
VSADSNPVINASADPRPAPTVLLEARGLVAGYGQSKIVRNLDLQVHASEVVALLGPNGAGKSTTLMTLAGVLPALGGEVLLHGAVTTAPLHKRVRAGLGLVSEERSVLMRLSVAENLRVNRGDSDHALELFPELKPHLSRRVGDLSGGQQQILALARALSRRPKVLLADELSLGLAPQVIDRLLKAVREAATGGVGVLLVEQHLEKALAIADRVLAMQRGEIKVTGTPADIRQGLERIRDLYFAAPPPNGNGSGPATDEAPAEGV